MQKVTLITRNWWNSWDYATLIKYSCRGQAPKSVHTLQLKGRILSAARTDCHHQFDMSLYHVCTEPRSGSHKLVHTAVIHASSITVPCWTLWAIPTIVGIIVKLGRNNNSINLCMNMEEWYEVVDDIRYRMVRVTCLQKSHITCRRFHQTLPNLGLILGLRTSPSLAL